MTSRFRSAIAAEAARAAAQPAGYPFHGLGVRARAIPFAAIAVVAEASLALPPGPKSPSATGVSIGLLLATAGFFLLPWSRLPGWAAPLAPLTYTASVLALILAAGSTSGVGIVILVPLIWTVLFQGWRETALVLLAIVIVELVISLVPAAAPASVIARRVVLWAALGTVIAVAAHGLRDRIARAQEESARLQAHLRQVTVMEDRERIAAGIQNTAIQRLFAVGLNLQGAGALIAEPTARSRVESAVTELDQVIQAIRDSIFAFRRTTPETGLRAEIIGLFTALSPTSEVRFSGRIEESLLPEMRGQLLDALREAVGIIQAHYAIGCVDVAAGPDSFVTVIEATASGATEQSSGGFDSQRLRHGAAQAGISLEIVTEAAAARFEWVMSLSADSERELQPPSIPA
ncbi:MAG TPA: hypothetical protein VME44_08365 [Streptosporangiaceae bacterium]|nr:hypothetical protein [Streptosporangiaceae bacterium]